VARDDYGAAIRGRLEREIGRTEKDAPFRVALTYPSPYHTGMSSLGFLQVYRLIQQEPGMCCERAFLPDGKDTSHIIPRSYENQRLLSSFPVIAVSVAYELEIAGLIRVLEAAGIPPLRRDRDARHPFVLAGGPLTFSNPLPLAGFVDAIVVGEADELIAKVLGILRDHPEREDALKELCAVPHVFVPEHHDALPSVARCDDSLLPARSTIRTPDTELSNMMLIETERGCSRTCTYCVMRRSTNGGMRMVQRDHLLELIPEDVRRVGLVGAAVSDHPKIVDIVNTLADRGAEVGLSSLRPDRLTDAFVGALRRGGYKTLTTAMDGPSDRLRASLERRAKPKHLIRAAELARAHRMKRLKLYLMVGLPGETDDDIDECASFVSELAGTIPISLGIAPFCAKRNTPLDGQPFAGIGVVQRRLTRLREGLRGRAEVRAISVRWAWVEYVLAQGDEAEGLAVYEAVRQGGSFAAYKKAFTELAERKPRRRSLAIAPI